MIQKMLRRIVCAGAVLGFVLASAPVAPATEIAAPTPSSIAQANGTGGWGSLLACGICTGVALAIIAAGPEAIILYVNTPGNAAWAVTCVTSCYAALS